MKLGVMQVVVGGADDAAVFARARRLEFEGVEVELAAADLTGASDARLEAVLAAREQTGLSVPSVCLGYLNEAGFVAEPKAAPQRVAEIRVGIEWAERVGAKVMLLPFFFRNDPKGNAEQVARVAQILSPLCHEASERGVTLCYEGTLAAEELVEMAQRADCEKGFGVYFDLANVVWVGMDGPEQIRKLGKLIRQVHMKETKVGPGDVRPGLGRVDYAGSAKALAEIGYDGWLVMETPGGEDEAMAEDAAFARRVFGA